MEPACPGQRKPPARQLPLSALRPLPVKTSAKKAGRRAKAPVSREAANGHERSPGSSAAVVRSIRAAAAPPPVDEIATVLLLAEGIARAGLSENEVLAISQGAPACRQYPRLGDRFRDAVPDHAQKRRDLAQTGGNWFRP